MKLVENKFFVTMARTFNLSVANIKRNGLLSLGVIIVIAILIVIFNILLLINLVASSAIKDLSSKVDFIIYLKDNVNSYEAQQMTAEIKGIDGVKKVSFISREEAFSIFKKNHPETAEFFEKYKLHNPLPPSIHITAEKPEYYSYIEKLIKEGRYSSLLENIADQTTGIPVIEKVTENLTKISSFAKHVLGWLIIVFIIGGAMIINNAILITIHSRRPEINIMRLVGAKPVFIRLPFIFEAIWYGTAATLLGFFITSILMWGNFLGGWSAFSESNLAIGVIFLIELLCAIAISVLSCMWSVHRNIKKHFLR